MKPKTWAEVNQKRVAHFPIEWDGEKQVEYIPVPLARGPVVIAVDNPPNVIMTLTPEHLLRVFVANASAEIGEGENGVLTVTVVKPGAEGNDYSINALVAAEPDADMNVGVGDNFVTVFLGTDANGDPDDAKNTIALIAAYINENHDTVITAEASGDGSGAISAAIEPVQFSGGVSQVWAESAAAAGTAATLTCPAQKKVVFASLYGFPRFMAGRLKVSAASAPTAESVTTIQVVEAR